MAENDIYNNESKYEGFKQNLKQFLLKPEERQGSKRKKKGKYYCKNKVNLIHFEQLFNRFEAKDISFVRRNRLLGSMRMICYVADKNLKDIEREELEVYKIYLDIGESGSKDSRPQFDLMLNDMRSKQFKAVLVYKLDRIGRSLQHLINLFEEFKNRGIEFISATQNINTITPEGKMFLRMLMVLAEYERELIVNRINVGLTRARKQGKTLGRPTGSKDTKRRRTSGYIQRWTKQTPLPI